MENFVPKRIVEALSSDKWAEILHPLLNKSHMKELWEHLDFMDNNMIQYNPKRFDMFNAFRQCDRDNLKVVILGQDPYPDPKNAMGLSFSVPDGIKRPASLQVIRKEVLTNYPTEDPIIHASESGDLTSWATQGVLLLNTALTVEAWKAGSHTKYWRKFSKELINEISKQHQNIVFMLWGTHAKKYKKEILGDHYVLEANHPANERYRAGKGGFWGCNHFRLANEYLRNCGREQISWLF